jgi:hypothetical protein
VAQHRHQRHEPGSARHEQQRAAVGRAPREVPADRAADLELVARPHLAGEVGRDLAVVDPLDGQLEPRALGRRGDRVGALRLVAVLGRQAHVHVLAGGMAGPAVDVERERHGRRRLLDDLAHARDAPDERRPGDGQSFQYRCSRQGSPWLW